MGVETTTLRLLSIIVLVLIVAPSLASTDGSHYSNRRPKKQGNDVIFRSEEESEGQQQEDYPYVFQDQHYHTGLQSEQGRVLVLQKFDDRSELLDPIKTYRILILEALPNGFFVPHLVDTEALLFITQGRGTVSKLWEDRRERYNVGKGDILRLESGVTMYAVNRDKSEKLVIVILTQSVFGSSTIKTFFAPGGSSPESFYNAFNATILEASFKTRRETLQKLFGKERQGGGAFVRATDEQIKALSGPEEGGESRGYASFNIFQHGVAATKSNEYGQLYEVNANVFNRLQDLDVAISFSNITKGSIEGPLYSSRATKILVVVSGEGYLEMSCPYMDRVSKIISYKKVAASLVRRTTVVVPAGHPTVTVASPNQNVQLLCFEINARNNHKFTLAGNNNVWKQLEKEALELSFGMSALEVDEIFQNQDKVIFFKGTPPR